MSNTRTRRTSRVAKNAGLSLAALATAAGILAGTPSPALAVTTNDTVMVTTQRMSQPTLNSTQWGWYAQGSHLALSCYEYGQYVQGYYSFAVGWDNLWYRTTDGGWVADVDINTYVNGPAAGTVRCSTLTPTAPTTSAVNGTIKRSEVISRARFWVNQRVPYSMYAYRADPQGKLYRTDCSGMVSMALHLDSSLSTVTLPGRVTEISKSSLQVGDLVGALGPNTAGSAGHVMIFNGWADAGHTQFYTLEETSDYSGTAQALVRPWGQWYSSHAYRYNNIVAG